MSMTIEERINQIQKEIKETPYHKGTEHHIGRLKARLAQLKDEQFGQFEKKSGSGGGGGYAVKKSGDASIVLVGPPSVGKSSLINKITDTQSKVGQYDFTTLGVVPGMMFYNGAKIQILDLPGIIEGASLGKGRGKEALSVVRNCDLILIMVDVNSITQVNQIKRELYEFGVRLDELPPKIHIKKDFRGGLKIKSNFPLLYSLDTVKALAGEFKIKNGEISIREKLSMERLIDGLMGNRVYLPYLVLINKIDQKKNFDFGKVKEAVPISARNGLGVEILKEKIWEKLNLLRIYLKPKDQAVDSDRPLIVKKGKNLGQILEEISLPNKELISRTKIYGHGAKFPGQEVSFTFQPQEGTIISFLQ